MPEEERNDKIVPVDISEEMKRSYIDYAMSVIVARALPDVRDGLKPVHRRILYAMSEAGNTPDKPYKKSARTVGDVLGKYHPHGDAAVYDALVRMAQDFAIRYPLIDGHGNFGCFTGDTKIKLLDGTERSFAELAALGPDARFYVYSVDRNGRIVVGVGRNARITRRAAQIIEVELDTGEKIRCTPDHRFMLRDGSYKQAQYLTPDDSLMAGYFDTAPVRPGSSDYLRIRQPSGEWTFVHHLADDFNAEKGLARQTKRGFVRHHKNFDRWDNRPDNIERLSSGEHNRVHAEHLKELWSSPTFRDRQRAGVRRFYVVHPEARERLRQRMIAQNQSPEFRAVNGRRVASSLRRLYAESPALRAQISARMRALWSEPAFRSRMSEALQGLVKRLLSPEERVRVAAVISEKSREMWSDPRKRQEIVAAIVRAMEDPELRKKLSLTARRLWMSPSYRAKFPTDHLRRLARRLWEDAEFRARHRERMLKMWSDPAFRRQHRRSVQESNRRRLAEDPTMMKRLTESAQTALRKRWRDPAYARRVMRRKIAAYVSRLLPRLGPEGLTREAFDSFRNANWIPRFEKAIGYFDHLEELVSLARTHNHRIVAVRWLDERADVYDITVDEHHNFLLASGVFVHNSIDGDPPAQMRYTEARLSRIAMELLTDLDKNTVDFQPNFDDKEEEPTVLPSRFPNLLVNGTAGIAVGMATNIPPHNLTECIDAVNLMIDNPDVTVKDLMGVIKGPDFPTAGMIMGREGIRQAYETGRGAIKVRGVATIEPLPGGKHRILITEIPYQVNKAKLIERIAELAREKRIDGITDLRDESDRTGLRVSVELRRDANAKIILNQLYKFTPLEQTFGVIMLALVDKQPRVLNLREMIYYYLEHQKEVVTRRTRFELEKAEARAHILEGLRIALDHIDAVIALIRASRTVEEARDGLMSQFGLSEKQAQAILDMRLQRLTGLEREKIEEEYAELLKQIEYYRAVLANERMLLSIIKKELNDIKERFGDERRTRIVAAVDEFSEEDLIPEEDMVITLTHAGYVKRLPLHTYRSQRRGGRGITGAATREEDFLEHLFVATTHHHMLFFTNRGKVYKLKVHEIPEAGRTAKGTAIVNLLQLGAGEKIAAVIPVRELDPDRYLFFATKNGLVKKTSLGEYENIRAGGLIAIGLEEGDELIDVRLTDPGSEIVLVSSDGLAIRFKEDEVRPMGRPARGVIGMRLDDDAQVVGMEVADDGQELLVVTDQGYGKRTPISEYRLTGRGGKGVKTINLTQKNGNLVGIKAVTPADELMLITANGILIRLPVAEVRETGRGTQGVIVMRVEPGDKVVALARIAGKEEDEGEEASGA